MRPPGRFFESCKETMIQPTDLTLRFDAIEVAPVIDTGNGSMERVTADHAYIDSWSVYLHNKDGGVQCLADCANEEDAMTVATALSHFMRGAPVHVIK